MSGEWKSHWPLRGERKRDKMNKNINPLLLKIIPSLPNAAVSEVGSSKSHNKSPHHKTWLEKKGTPCCTMLNLRILIMLSLKGASLDPMSIKRLFPTSLTSQIVSDVGALRHPTKNPARWIHKMMLYLTNLCVFGDWQNDWQTCNSCRILCGLFGNKFHNHRLY